jgi:phosphoenolpyruvate carboxylase
MPRKAAGVSRGKGHCGTHPGAARFAAAGYLSPKATTALVRACGLYAQLFNIAEDLHHTRRRRAHQIAGSRPQQGSLNRALARLKEEGVSFAQLSDTLQDAYVGAILTAHPTEVQRQSVLDGHRAVRKFLSQLGSPDITPEEETELDGKLKRVILSMWQTSEIRHFKLSVEDEIKNGVAYHPMTFFSALPRLYDRLGKEVTAAWGKARCCRPSFAWAAGLVATVTATPTSTPPCCAMPLPCKPPRLLSTICPSWRRCTANCRCPSAM